MERKIMQTLRNMCLVHTDMSQRGLEFNSLTV